MRPRINTLTLRSRSGVAALTALATLAAPAVPAFATTNTPAAPVTQTIANQANASEQKNGRTDWALKYQVQQSYAATLNVNNTATASQCHRCAADGIAFQVVVTSTQNLVTLYANNLANAVSSNCVSCSTFAGAYQIVYASDTGKLTQWQSRALGLLQIQLTGLRFENLSSTQLQIGSTNIRMTPCRS